MFPWASRLPSLLLTIVWQIESYFYISLITSSNGSLRGASTVAFVTAVYIYERRIRCLQLSIPMTSGCLSSILSEDLVTDNDIDLAAVAEWVRGRPGSCSTVSSWQPSSWSICSSWEVLFFARAPIADSNLSLHWKGDTSGSSMNRSWTVTTKLPFNLFWKVSSYIKSAGPSS